MREDGNERGLPEIGGFATHVGAGDEGEVKVRGIKRNVVGDEAGGVANGQLFNDGVTTFVDAEFAAFGEYGAGVAIEDCDFSQGGGEIEIGDGDGGLADAASVGGDEVADLVEDLFFKRQNTIFRGEYFAFQFLQFRRCETFGID